MDYLDWAPDRNDPGKRPNSHSSKTYLHHTYLHMHNLPAAVRWFEHVAESTYSIPPKHVRHCRLPDLVKR